jgi:plasmid maintenance system antidote protein VapI
MKQVSLKYYINIELGISLKQAAELIGVTPQYLGVVMAGKRPAGRPLCVKLAKWGKGRINLTQLMMIQG